MVDEEANPTTNVCLFQENGEEKDPALKQSCIESRILLPDPERRGALFFMGCLPIVGKVPLGGGQFWTPMPVEQANFPLKIAIAHDMRRRKTPLNMHTKKTFNFYLESDPGLGCSGLEPLNGLDPSPSLGFLSRRPAGKCHPPV